MVTNANVGYQQSTTDWGSKLHPGLCPSIAHLTEPLSSERSQENIAWKQPRECHDIRVVLLVAQQHPCLLDEVLVSTQRWPFTLESSYSSPSMTQKQHVVPPDWSHE